MHLRGLLLLGLLLRLVVASAPIRWLVQKTVPDDAFVYFQVARNLIAGAPPSLDGVHFTSAYHPLWLGFVTCVASLIPGGGDRLITAGIVLAGLIDILNAYLVFLVARTLTASERYAVVACVLYLFNPYSLGLVLSGLETPVYVTTTLACFGVYLNLVSRPSRPWQPNLVLGGLAGLAMLARTDAVFFHLAMLGHLILLGPGTRLERLKATCALAFSSAVIVLPWLIYMHRETGHLMQSSAHAIPFVNHAHAADLTRIARVATSAWKTLKVLCYELPRSAGFGVPFALLLLCWIRKRRLPAVDRQASSQRLLLLAPPLAALVALGFVHGGIRWVSREWYYVPVAWLGPLGFVLLYKEAAPYLRQRGRVALSTLVFLGTAISAADVWVKGLFPWQVDMYDMAQELQRVVPRSDRPRIAGFNMHMQAYYNFNQVMNLDGVGNDEAADWVRERRVGDYLEVNGIEYLVDNDHYIKQRFAPFLPPDVLQQLGTVVIEKASWATAKKWRAPWRVYRLARR
ncbi:MAG: glycosyltransferase family 39 protein [Myxococcales bacterium]|nr:glycosyltransferase family 39 protein [Myxococcales bacterium]